MRGSKIALSGLLAISTMGLTGCSAVHGFLNPPPFSAPATQSPTDLPPDYIAPGSTLAELNLSSDVPKATLFETRSDGFTIMLSCSASSDTRVKVRISIEAAERSVISSCSSKPKTVLTLSTPSAVDGEGPNVRVIAEPTGRMISSVTVKVLSGSS